MGPPQKNKQEFHKKNSDMSEPNSNQLLSYRASSNIIKALNINRKQTNLFSVLHFSSNSTLKLVQPGQLNTYKKPHKIPALVLLVFKVTWSIKNC